MKLIFICVIITSVFGICIVSASYKRSGHHKKGKRCYQCAWSPPKVAYAKVQKAVSYSSPSRIYGKSWPRTTINYGLKKVPVKVQGGWDKCRDTFTKYHADKYGIDQWECEHNCYTRTDSNGNLYRGCFKGEYNVNPKKLGCHHQAGSVYCFCAGELCNNKQAPGDRYSKDANTKSTYYNHYPNSPKSNYADILKYEYNAKSYNIPKYGYFAGPPYKNIYNYGSKYPKSPIGFKKAGSYERKNIYSKNYTPIKSYKSYDKKSNLDQFYGKYGKFDKYDKDGFGKYGTYDVYDKYGGNSGKVSKYDWRSGSSSSSSSSSASKEHKPRYSKYTSKDIASELGYGYKSKVKDQRKKKYKSGEFGYAKKILQYGSYEDDNDLYARKEKLYRYQKPKSHSGYSKMERFTKRPLYRRGTYRYGHKRPIKHYIHPIKDVKLSKRY